LPSPDGTRLVIMADGALYESKKTATGWEPRTKLGPDINQGEMQVGPLFSPTGKSLLFARDTKGPNSGEFFVWYRNGVENWPPACRPRG
jgi:hypothetical protein